MNGGQNASELSKDKRSSALENIESCILEMLVQMVDKSKWIRYF